MFCKKYGIDLSDEDYVSDMTFLDYLDENVERWDITLDKFRKMFGSVWFLLPSRVPIYNPKKKKEEYVFKTSSASDYKEQWDAIAKSVKDGKDYLFELVKDSKLILDPNVEY